MQGGLHPLAAFGHRLIGQADNLDAHLSRRDHDLHLDGHTLYALKCNRIDPCHHGLPPQTGRVTRASCPITATRKQRATGQRIKQEHPANNFSLTMYFSCV